MKTTGTGGYFTLAFIVTALGLLASIVYGFHVSGGLAGAAPILFITAVLAVLEISLSFDNAIVNANRLKSMTPEWRHRFLTWGILIAVFGMRIVFPLAIVAIAASTGPISAIRIAFTQPDEYARIMHEAHLSIAAFGGTFLMMVSFGYFFDQDKDVHWIEQVERHLVRFASIKGIEVAVVLAIVLGFSTFLEGPEAHTFLVSSMWGLLTFLCVEVLSSVLDASKEVTQGAARGGLGAFLYLEVLDSSFSFDGVIGAFALTQNLFVIAVGLGIGAMYVRSMTIMLVEKGTLARYRYLEHGAFYSVLALSLIMYAQTLVHVPEVVTGLGAAGLIGLSLRSSLRHRSQHAAELAQ